MVILICKTLELNYYPSINLTCASRVHLLEPHWNPMVEQQAVERVHRLGQTRDVVITRYIMSDSFEIVRLPFVSSIQR